MLLFVYYLTTFQALKLGLKWVTHVTIPPNKLPISRGKLQKYSMCLQRPVYSMGNTTKKSRIGIVLIVSKGKILQMENWFAILSNSRRILIAFWSAMQVGCTQNYLCLWHTLNCRIHSAGQNFDVLQMGQEKSRLRLEHWTRTISLHWTYRICHWGHCQRLHILRRGSAQWNIFLYFWPTDFLSKLSQKWAKISQKWVRKWSKGE